MLKRSNVLTKLALGWVVALVFVTSCNRSNPTPPAATATSIPTAVTPALSIETPTLTPTEQVATLTAVPLAASVNGWGITMEEYRIYLALYQAAQQQGGTNLATDDLATETITVTQIVLDDLISETLLAQAAQEAGLMVDDELLQTHLDRLAGQLGGQQALNEWLATNGFSEEAFRRALSRSVAAAWMRDQIVNAVPTVAEQIHARQILLYNSGEADTVLAQLRNGADFGELAFQYDPVAGGDLGWFPRGYLVEAAIEAVAFTLQPEQFSEVVQTRLGYHIVQVIERDPQRPLSFGARLVLQETALRQWLSERRNQSDIQVFLP